MDLSNPNKMEDQHEEIDASSLTKIITEEASTCSNTHHTTAIAKPKPSLIAAESPKAFSNQSCNNSMTEQQSTSDMVVVQAISESTTNKDDEEVRVKNDFGPPVGNVDRGVEFVVCEGGEDGEGGESGEAGDDEATLFETWEMGEGASEMLLELNEELSKILDPTNTLRTPPPTINMSPLECHALQTEEIEMLQAIYDEDMTPLNDNCTCFVIDIKFLSDEIQDDDVIKIWFSLPHNYPCVPPVFEIEANRSGSFSYRDADDLFDLLMAESINRTGGMMIFDLVSIAQEYMPALVERKKELEAKQKELDLERKKTIELEDALKSRGVPREIVDVFFDEEPASPSASDGNHDDDDEYITGERAELPIGYSSHALLRPGHFTGPISDIIKSLPEGLQITRIENIMRQDLARNFQSTVNHASRSLWEQERKNPMMYNLKPQIAFHGTRTKSLPSIVHHGLVIPGKGNKVDVRCGSSLGLGIYLSPNANFSLGYSDTGNRLIVCAALLGRMFKAAYSAKGKFTKHNTYISECGNEWVFFNAAQVLPCYVIQVQYTPKSSRGKQSNPPPLAGLGMDSLQNTEEESERERKAKLLARARKFLPYGFGPGGRTVIEDAASFDDDEEDYGDYQMMRYADAHDTDWSGGHVLQKEQSELQKYRFKDPLERTLSVEND